MTYLENALSLSTLTHHDGRRPRRYLSAEHAAATYADLITRMAGVKAIDYARPIVQSAPSSENPALEAVDDLHELREVFRLVEHRVGDRWPAWWLVRVELVSVRAVASRLTRPESPVSRSSVSRYVQAVDLEVEQTLSDRRLLVRTAVRLEAGGGAVRG